MLALVNAYRATTGPRGDPRVADRYERVLRAGPARSKSIALSAGRRVELVAQVFNLLNRKNLTATWQTNALSSSFGTITSAGNMRQAELAVRFSF